MRRVLYSVVLAMPLLVLTDCKTNKMEIKTKPYPVSKMEDVKDDYFGTVVADPYRWLEDDNSQETAAWVAAQNEVTFDYLSQIPYRDALRERLTKLWDYPKYGVPQKSGGLYYFYENDGLQNQSVMYCAEEIGGEQKMFFDPNTLSEDGTVALSWHSFSPDDKYMAYAVSNAGSDWVEIRVKEMPSGRDLPDVIKWVKFSGAAWYDDGFMYGRYDEPSAGGELSAQNRHQKVYFHKLGTPQSADQLIYEDPEHPLRYLSAGVSRDYRQMYIFATDGTSGTEVLYRDAARGETGFKVLFKGFENDYSLVYAKGDMAIFHTNDSAPNFKLVSVYFGDKEPVISDLVPETDNLMEGASVAGGDLFAFYLDDAKSAVKQFVMDGEFRRDVELPGIGSAGGFRGDEGEATVYYSFSGFTSPTEIYAYNIESGASQLVKRPEVAFDPEDFVSEQVFFTSRDGTQVPMFIVHRKDMERDGQNPLYLYGYGGFNISMTPGFSLQNIALMEQGGIYVMVNLRGGSEYGEQWHKAGMLEKKQNVFDDFIAAAEYLVSEGYTSSDRLAIAGGSNGGLLVGACMTQRPDLYAVALPAVGVMDMLRYHRFTVGWGWVVEYGSSDNELDFNYLYKYSPLHNIRPGVCYPATLVTTADHDDRVVPAHSFKFAATLQAAQAQVCDNPTLIRIETNAGHGAGKPTSKRIDESADVLSFMLWNTGVREVKQADNQGDK